MRLTIRKPKLYCSYCGKRLEEVVIPSYTRSGYEHIVRMCPDYTAIITPEVSHHYVEVLKTYKQAYHFDPYTGIEIDGD